MVDLTKEQQADAVKMAYGLDIPNFSKPGTGKTLTSLDAFKRTGLERLVVCCPKIALHMWKENIESYLGADATIIRTGKQRITNSTAVIMTYDIAAKRVAELHDMFRGNSALINDESHYIRNATAKRTQAMVGKRLDLNMSIAENFSQVWNMTGTPMEGYADDYYTQVVCFHPDEFRALGIETLEQFERQFLVKRQKQYNPHMAPVWKPVANKNELLLNKIIYEKIGAIRRMEAPGLPPIRFRDLEVELKFDNRLKKELKLLTHEQIIQKINDPNSFISKWWRTIGLAKVPEALPYLGELMKQGPVLIGVWHRDVGSELQNRLIDMGFNVEQVHGGTSDTFAEIIRNKFNRGDLHAIIGQMKKMGVSWNLQEAAKNVVILEEYPSASVIEQFYKRVYRFGQKEAVQVDFITSDTPVDKALRSVRVKKETSNEVIND